MSRALEKAGVFFLLCTAAAGDSASGSVCKMGRGKKGRSITTPSWEDRDDLTPFKLAEKRLKRYAGRTPDLSGVLDFGCGARSEGVSAPADVKAPAVSSGGRRAEAVPGREGLFVLPGFLSDEEQLRLAERCLAEYPAPQHRCNLTPQHGAIDRI